MTFTEAKNIFLARVRKMLITFDEADMQLALIELMRNTTPPFPPPTDNRAQALAWAEEYHRRVRLQAQTLRECQDELRKMHSENKAEFDRLTVDFLGDDFWKKAGQASGVRA